MLSNLVSNVKDSARATARAATYLALGVVIVLAGFGFLTAALWMLIASQESALFATTSIGIAYSVIGSLIVMFAARRNRGTSQQHSGIKSDKAAGDPPAPREPFVQLAEGFAIGLQAGRSARSGN